MAISRTNKILTGALCLGLVAVGGQVAYGAGQASSRAAWANGGLTLCVDRADGSITMPGTRKCGAGTSTVKVATSNQLVAAIDYARSGPIEAAPSASAAAGTSTTAVTTPNPTVTVYATGPAGPQGATGAQGPAGPQGSSGSGVSGGGGLCDLATYPTFTSVDAQGCRLTNVNLDGTDWSYANLSNAQWFNVTTNPRYDGNAYVYSNFAHANLSGFAAPGGGIFAALFNYANVTGAHFSMVSHGAIHLTGLSSMQMTPDARGTRAQRVLLNDPTYGDVLLGSCIDVPGIDLHGRDLSGPATYYDGGWHYGVQISDGNCPTMPNWSGANLSGMNWSWGDLNRSNLTSALFTGSNLTDANLTYANLTNASFANATLFHAGFSGANLTNANLSHANLATADMHGVTLNGANLTSANLDGALFGYGANLQGSTYTTPPTVTADTEVDSTTRCVNGNLFTGSSLSDKQHCILG